MSAPDTKLPVLPEGGEGAPADPSRRSFMTTAAAGAAIAAVSGCGVVDVEEVKA